MKSFLIDKKVMIVPIQPGANGVFKDAPTETGLYTGCTRSIVTQMRQNGTLVDPLTPEEKEFFSKELDMSFDIYKKPEDSFWCSKQGRISFRKLGRNADTAAIILDLSTPFGYLHYKLCLAHSKVGKKWEDRNNPEYDYVIKDVDAEQVEELDYGKMRLEVMTYLVQNKSKKKALYDLLRLYSGSSKFIGKVASEHTTEWLGVELGKLIENRKSVKILYDILQLDTASLEQKVFIEDAISIGTIKKLGNKYLIEGVEDEFYNDKEVINFIYNVKNQSIKLRISEQIKSKN